MIATSPVKTVDRADRRASHKVNGQRDTLAVRALGVASEIGDQPQMRWLCTAVMIAGIFRFNGKLIKTGLKMRLAHSLATRSKSAVKAIIDRTRPDEEGGGYKFTPGTSTAHAENSFPSGHSAGVMAVAVAYASEYPQHEMAAYAVAGSVASAQVPRGKHFIGDVIVGSLIGLAAGKICNSIIRPRQEPPIDDVGTLRRLSDGGETDG